MRRLIIVIVFSLSAFALPAEAGNGGPLLQSPHGIQVQSYVTSSAGQRFLLETRDIERADTALVVDEGGKKDHEMTSRRVNALLLSVVVPGAGQTMLGDPYKGVGFTLAYFGSALTALISHNNFVARGERLDALEFQYATATNWASSNFIYGQMKESSDLWKQDRNRRNVFLVVSAVIWIANIADLLYNTEDKGEKIFSQNAANGTPRSLSAVPLVPQGAILFTIALPIGR
jgi:TM2 domain-containing membrane protein YozV